MAALFEERELGCFHAARGHTNETSAPNIPAICRGRCNRARVFTGRKGADLPDAPITMIVPVLSCTVRAPEGARAQYQLGFFSGGYTGFAGTKPLRFGISTFGRVFSSRTSFSPMMPF
jgi:hypothetical protein